MFFIIRKFIYLTFRIQKQRNPCNLIKKITFLPKNFKFLNLKYNTASSYDTEVLKYIESLKESVFIIYCQHGSASMYMGFIVGDGKYGTVLRFEYDSLYVNGCSGNAWAGWTKLG